MNPQESECLKRSDMCRDGADGKDLEKVDVVGQSTSTDRDKTGVERCASGSLSEPSANAETESHVALRKKLEIYQDMLTYLEMVFSLTGYECCAKLRCPSWAQEETEMWMDYEGVCVAGGAYGHTASTEQLWMYWEEDYCLGRTLVTQPETIRYENYIHECLVDVKKMPAMAVRELACLQTKDVELQQRLTNLLTGFKWWDAAIKDQDETRGRESDFERGDNRNPISADEANPCVLE
ncbi:MAG: hypothetical protein Q9159_006945 [Coniocarpon cinnabarinum]